MDKKQLERAEKIAKILSMLTPFTPNSYDGCQEFKPILSRQFVMKDLLGLDYEEIARNNNWIIEEMEELKNSKKRKKND